MTKHYGWWMILKHDQFKRLIDPTNQVTVLLATHWISLKMIMAEITEQEYRARHDAGRPQKKEGDVEVGIIRWLKYLNGLIDDQHRPYNAWPLWIEAQLDIDISYFGRGDRRNW